MNVWIRALWAVMAAAMSLMLTACGGSGGEGGSTPPAVAAPGISSQPTAANVTVGAAASFSVVATGSAPLSYQWQRDGVAIAGATSASYTLGVAALADTGAQFRVVVTNAAGAATSNAATLTVVAANAAPAITAQPVGVTVTAGTTANFSVQTDGSTPLTFQWQRNGVPISGATAATFNLVAPTVADSGSTFRVVVTNSVGSVTSENALLTIAQSVVAPSIVTQPQSLVGTDGAPIIFSVSATGTGPLAYQWRKNGVNIPAATLSLYATPTLTVADSGAVYSVVVTNGGGSVTSANATLTVNYLPAAWLVQPLATTVAQGQTVQFIAAAYGSQPVTYQWRRNGVAIPGATGLTYTTAATTLADDGALYSVVATNPANSITSADARLTVQGAAVAPSIATAPVNTTVSEGQTATFNAVAAGTAPLTYQWRRNAVDIAGATAASYSTPATTAADNAARFSVRVTNSAGSVISSEAVLTVQAATGGLIGKAWATGQLLDQTDNEVLALDRVIDDSGRVTVVYMQYNGTRWQLFGTRGTPNGPTAPPSWSAPVALDIQGSNAVFADSRYSYFFGVSGSPNGNAVAYWTFGAPCTSTTYRTQAGTCQYVITARYLASIGSWEAPMASGSFPGNPANVSINNRGDIAFVAIGGTPATNYPYYTERAAVAWRAVGDASFRTQLLNGPISKFTLALDGGGNMLVGAELTQNATTDAAYLRGTLAAGFGDAQVLDTRGAAVSAVTPVVGAAGQQLITWNQNNGTRTSVYVATSANATAAFAVQDMGITDWEYIVPLDDGQILLVDYANLRRYRWVAGTWGTAETIPNWRTGYTSPASNCAITRNGDGLCVNSSGLWSSYESARNVMVQRQATASPGTGYVLGFNKNISLRAPVLSVSGHAFTSTLAQFDVLPTVANPAGDGRNVVNLWGFYFK